MNILDQLVDYSRQQGMDNEYINTLEHPHTIIGVGGIGYWLAVLLAMQGANRITLVDGDRVETTNLNRLPCPPRFNGRFKVNACKAQLRLLRPGISVPCIPAHITEATIDLLGNMLQSTRTTVWDCTDDARVQIKISAFCQAHAYRYVKLGYEGWKIGAYRRMTDTWLPDNYQPGYTSSKANACSSALAAAIGIMYYTQDDQRDLEVDLRSLVTQGEQHG